MSNRIRNRRIGIIINMQVRTKIFCVRNAIIVCIVFRRRIIYDWLAGVFHWMTGRRRPADGKITGIADSIAVRINLIIGNPRAVINRLANRRQFG